MEGVKMVYFGEKMVQKWYTNKNSNKNKFFNCDLCLFTSTNKKDFIRHIKTNKHGTKWYMTFNNHDCLIECNDCDYLSCDFDDSIKHFDNFSHIKKTPKKPQKNPKNYNENKAKTVHITHENVVNDYSINNENRIVCSKCMKSYKYKSGFYRHRKRCYNSSEIIEDDFNSNNTINKLEKYNYDKTTMILINAIMQSTETNSKLCERINALENTVSSSNKVVNNTITNNINKQEFNINVFLNQECKNAMNLKDFLQNIQLNIEDLYYTANNGFIKGITNIFIKNLEEMALNERPIHSIQDNTNHQFYIKNENKWEFDKEDNKIDQSIDCLTKRQINKIKDWESQHPNWEDTDLGIKEYMHIVQTIMGGGNENERQQNKELIKKEIVNRVKLDTNSIVTNSII
jgi:hypothetical protein